MVGNFYRSWTDRKQSVSKKQHLKNRQYRLEQRPVCKLTLASARGGTVGF